MDLPPDFAPTLAAVADPPPYLLTRPARQTVPLVFASPHSGRLYPPEFVAAARLDPVALRKSEDGFVDELFAAAPDSGAPLLAATFPRVFCDVNREPWELDPNMFDGPLPAWVNTASPRVGAGLGTIARVVATGEPVYRHKLTFAEAEDRIRRYWQPYHAALAALIAETRAEFGYCLLIDCHSMPTHPAQAASPPDFVLGDAHGTACAPRATRLAEEALLQMGYRVRRNDPYAGGYVTRHYGRPRERVHALQIEVARPLYMDELRIERLPGMARLVSDLTRLIRQLAEADWTILR
ncbi:N-formylglutamate amidohydrolase [Siccirubricoccus phaeus]|uniref:N-formylglutamate amidohydrolase n=1 Tax=Siccirubricoccus phaeus TaxID=2595053 RepID=UPI0011F3DFA5|nr:N-formylglutamate amidohydrolase [Siccirubricoccus phaeus]